MDYQQFPLPRCSKSVVAKYLDEVLLGDIVVSASEGNSGILALSRMSSKGQWNKSYVPSIYGKYLKLIIYRFYSLALVLDNWDEFTSTDHTISQLSWMTLSQHLTYFKNIFGILSRASEKSKVNSHWRCADFERFLVTELVVKRHEPIYVYAYRASRKDGEPNLTTCSFSEIGEHSLLSHCYI